MAALDLSLDDMIKTNKEAAPVRRGGRAPSNRSNGARNRAAPYGNRPSRRAPVPRQDDAERSNLKDVASSSDPTLKVSSSSKPNTVAGAICNVMRESPSGEPPAILATGPVAINQAIKAIAIARKYLQDEAEPCDLLVSPQFEQDVRSGSNVSLTLQKCKPVPREPSEDDLSAKEKTDAFKLAGAIASRIRDGEEVAVTTKGAIPVLVAIKALALAQDYVAEENINLKFTVKFADLENTEIRTSENVTSTYLHFAVLPKMV